MLIQYCNGVSLFSFCNVTKVSCTVSLDYFVEVCENNRPWTSTLRSVEVLLFFHEILKLKLVREIRVSALTQAVTEPFPVSLFHLSAKLSIYL